MRYTLLEKKTILPEAGLDPKGMDIGGGPGKVVTDILRAPLDTDSVGHLPVQWGGKNFVSDVAASRGAPPWQMFLRSGRRKRGGYVARPKCSTQLPTWSCFILLQLGHEIAHNYKYLEYLMKYEE